MSDPPSTVSTVVAGTMGAGLAVQFARHGVAVTLIDHRESNLAAADEAIADAIAFLRTEGLLAASASPADRIERSLDAADGVADTEFVLETVSEDRGRKQAVFETVAGAAPDDAVLASNTSGIPITELGTFVPDPERASAVTGGTRRTCYRSSRSSAVRRRRPTF